MNIAMMYKTDDPIADYDRWDAEQARWRERLPECEMCGERIEDDYAYDIDGSIICPDCMDKHFKKSIDDLVV